MNLEYRDKALIINNLKCNQEVEYKIKNNIVSFINKHNIKNIVINNIKYINNKLIYILLNNTKSKIYIINCDDCIENNNIIIASSKEQALKMIRSDYEQGKNIKR